MVVAGRKPCFDREPNSFNYHSLHSLQAQDGGYRTTLSPIQPPPLQMQVPSFHNSCALPKTFHRSSGAYYPPHPLKPQDSQSSLITTTTDNLEASYLESPLTSSLQDATTTIDDLTSAMANFSRMPSPSLPDTLISCCCDNTECTNRQAWVEFKAKLESRLILCAGEIYRVRLPLRERYADRRRVACVLRLGTRV